MVIGTNEDDDYYDVFDDFYEYEEETESVESEPKTEVEAKSEEKENHSLYRTLSGEYCCSLRCK